MKRWEAKGMMCGQLVFELRQQISRIEPGESLEVITDRPGVQVDLAAWCCITGNTLQSAEPPTFVIRRSAVVAAEVAAV